MKNLKLIWLILLTCLCAGSVLAQEKISECIKYEKGVFATKKISLNFEEAELQTILATVTKQTGCEFIVDKSVGKPVFSINISNMPWDEVVKSLISFENLEIQKNGPMFRIASADVLKSEANLPKDVLVKNEIIILKSSLYPASMSKEELEKLISAQLSENGSFEIDEKSNALKLVDLEKNLIAVKKLITKLYLNLIDKEVPEKAKQKKP